LSGASASRVNVTSYSNGTEKLCRMRAGGKDAGAGAPTAGFAAGFCDLSPTAGFWPARAGDQP
jgi:hypothetical protein